MHSVLLPSNRICHDDTMHGLLITHRSQRRKPRSQQDELDGIEEIGLSAPVPPQNAVRGGCEGMDFGLLPKGPKIGDCDLFDVHGSVVEWNGMECDPVGYID